MRRPGFRKVAAALLIILVVVLGIGIAPRRSDDADVAGVGKVLADAAKGQERALADVIAEDEASPMSDADFDDALWLSLLGRVRVPTDLQGLPPGVRMYFATRTVEWDIGDGGLAAAFEWSSDYFDPAIEGYRLLGDEASMDLLGRAQAVAGDGAALAKLDAELQGPPWHGVPWSDEERIAYVRAHRDEFRLE